MQEPSYFGKYEVIADAVESIFAKIVLFGEKRIYRVRGNVGRDACMKSGVEVCYRFGFGEQFEASSNEGYR